MAELIAVQGDITRQHVDAIVNAATRLCWAAAESMAPFIAQPAPGSSPTAENLTAAPLEMQKPPPASTFPRIGFSTPSAPSGTAASTKKTICSKAAIAAASSSLRAQVRSIAFPAISTGVYSFPPDRAAQIAVDTVREHVAASGVDSVTFVCFSSDTLQIYNKLLAAPAHRAVV